MENSLAIIFIFGICPISVFIMIFGLRYLENRENMSMIAQGMNPAEGKRRKRRELDPSRTLKDSLLFIGAGIGLLLALFISNAMNWQGSDKTGVFFGFIAVGGGIGMLAAYLYERKNPPSADKEV